MDPPSELKLTDTAQNPWRVRLNEAGATFIPDVGAAAVVARDAATRAMKVFTTLTGKAALLVSLDERRAVFHLEPSTLAAFGGWIGRDAMTRMAVRAFATIALVCGALWIVGSFPLDGDPDAGVAAIPIDVLGMGLGVLGIIAGAIGRWSPRRYVLVLDAAWCIGVAVHGLWDVVYDAASPLWLVFSAALAAQALGQLRLFFALGALPKAA